MKLAAIAAFVLVGLAVGQTIRPIPETQTRLVGQVPAEWWVYVRVGDGIPSSYTVPSDRHFVVTDSLVNGTDVLANGVSCIAQLEPVRMGTTTHGTRVVFEPGTVLTCPNAASLWGYLEPVR